MFFLSRKEVLSEVLARSPAKIKYTSDNNPEVTSGKVDLSLGNLFRALWHGKRANLTATVADPGEGCEIGGQFNTRP